MDEDAQLDDQTADSGDSSGSLTPDDVRAALGSVRYPGLNRDVVSFGMVHHVAVCDNRVRVQLALKSPAPDTMQRLDRDIRDRLESMGAVSVAVELVAPPPRPQPAGSATGRHGSPDPWGDQVRLKAVRHVIAVGAGKGGVGKSTVAVNLALTLARDGLRVGLLDADIYGPSLPILLDIEDGAKHMQLTPEKHIVPLEAYGVPLVSFGFFLGEGSPAIWRGPMVSKAVRQFVRGVAWPELDMLIVDLPPGTGDIPLSLAQSVQLSGAVVVTQPPRVAAAEARKAIEMFGSLEVPVLGVVENMSGAFGSGAGRQVSESASVPFLGAVPFDPEIVREGDTGLPGVIARPASETSLAFQSIAEQVAASLGWKRLVPAPIAGSSGWRSTNGATHPAAAQTTGAEAEARA
jgi:ATP-binding protein involved in chromosome partitioning